MSYSCLDTVCKRSKKYQNVSFFSYHTHSVDHLKKDEPINCFCDKLFGSDYTFKQHFKIDPAHQRERLYYETITCKNNKKQKRLRTTEVTPSEDNEHFIDIDIDNGDNREDNNRTRTLIITAEHREMKKFVLEKTKEILKIKINNSLYNTVIIEIVSLFGNLFREISDKENKDEIISELVGNFKSNKTINKCIEKMENYIQPIETPLEAVPDQPLFYHYVPLEKSLEKMCSDEDVFREMFLPKYAQSK